MRSGANAQGKYVLDVYKNDSAEIVAAYVRAQPAAGLQQAATLMRAIGTTTAQKLKVDFETFMADGSQIRYHDSIVLNSPFILIETAEEYIKMLAVLLVNQ